MLWEVQEVELLLRGFAQVQDLKNKGLITDAELTKIKSKINDDIHKLLKKILGDE